MWSIIDNAPLALRLSLAIIAVLLVLYSLDFLEFRLLLLSGSILLLLILLFIGLREFGFPRVNLSSSSESYFRALEVEIRSGKSGAAGELSRIISDRATKTSTRYILLSILEGELRRSFIILVSEDSKKINVEAEVLKTLLTSLVDGIRVSEVNYEELRVLADWVLKLNLHSKGLLFISDKTLGERQLINTSPASSVENNLILGEALDNPMPKPYTLTLRDIEGHIGIFGSTGSGKSTTLSIIVERVWRNLKIPVILLDWTGEHVVLFKTRGIQFKEYNPMDGGASINPLDIESDIDYIVSVMVKALSLSPPQAYMLMRALESFKPRSLRELEESIAALTEESKWDKEVKRALLRKISMLTRGSYNAFKETKSIELNGISIVRLDYIKNILARKSYALFLLARMFMERSSSNESEPRILIAIDEAHNIFSGEESHFIEQLFSECRKYGVILAIATQSPASIPNGILLNTNTKIIHALRSSRDKTMISETMSLKREYVDIIDKLGSGEAIIQAPSNPEPTLIQVQLVDESSSEFNNIRVYREPVNIDTSIPGFYS
ncbi:MAG: ATP-binding protein [Acidilobaceae archaeon]